MKLRQAQTLGVFDHHQAGIGDVNTDLNDRSRNQQIDFGCSEGCHAQVFFPVVKAPVYETYPEPGQRFTELLVGDRRRLVIQRVGLLYQRTDPVNLPASCGGTRDPFDDLAAAGFRDDRGAHGLPVWRQLVEN